ncbi:DUF3795 domain-containing protein [Chloroflexota bacterium]
MDRALISPCGLYCGVCPLYIARTDETLRGKIARQRDIPVEKVTLCQGCRPSRGMVTVAGGDTICDTYRCAVNDKKVEFCYECEDFPCLKLAPCADRAHEIPHNTKIYNLILLQKLGIDVWTERYASLRKQYRQGKKPQPGGDIQI